LIIKGIVPVTGYIFLESFCVFELKVNLYLQNMNLARFDQKRIFVVTCYACLNVRTTCAMALMFTFQLNSQGFLQLHLKVMLVAYL